MIIELSTIESRANSEHSTECAELSLWVFDLSRVNVFEHKNYCLIFHIELALFIKKILSFSFPFLFQTLAPTPIKHVPPRQMSVTCGACFFMRDNETTTSLARNLRTFHVGHTGYR